MTKIPNIPHGYLLLEEGDEVKPNDLFCTADDIKDLTIDINNWSRRQFSTPTGKWEKGFYYTIQKATSTKRMRKRLAPFKFKIGEIVRIGRLTGMIYGRCRAVVDQVPIYLVNLQLRKGIKDPALSSLSRKGFCYTEEVVEKVVEKT